jgi:FKBP-type peptidyl-prolyl cis-trans isomerase SlyD
MEVAKDRVVRVDVALSDLWGNVIQEAGEPMLYLHGGYDNIVPAVEAVLEGRHPGDRVEVQVDPEDAFGDYDELLLRVEPRASFPDELEVGMQFEGMADDPDEDEDAPRVYIVTDIADDKVVLDGNHPLAGIALKFDCKVLEVREATEAEVEQGHPDDPDAAPLRVV